MKIWFRRLDWKLDRARDYFPNNEEDVKCKIGKKKKNVFFTEKESMSRAYSLKYK